MKTIENLYNEVQGNDELKKEFVTSFKEGKVEEFLKAHDCNATAADVQEFLSGKDMEEMSDDDLDNVEVMAWGGLLVDLYRQLGCCASVRGIRSESDFRYESEHALANRLLYSGYDAVLLPCRDDLSLISSSMVKEVGSYGGDISKMVPAEIIDLVKDKLLKGRT